MLNKPLIKIAELLHLLYKLSLSPLLSSFSPNCGCRFYPSCSDYTLQAVKEYGVSGFIMGTKRIFRCNSFNNGGYDPVPGKTDANKKPVADLIKTKNQGL